MLQSATGRNPCSSVGELWNLACLKKRAILPSDANIYVVCKYLLRIGYLVASGTAATTGWVTGYRRFRELSWAESYPHKVKKMMSQFPGSSVAGKRMQRKHLFLQGWCLATWATLSPKWLHPRGCTPMWKWEGWRKAALILQSLGCRGDLLLGFFFCLVVFWVLFCFVFRHLAIG